jgi:hypothetical protein
VFCVAGSRRSSKQQPAEQQQLVLKDPSAGATAALQEATKVLESAWPCATAATSQGQAAMTTAA